MRILRQRFLVTFLSLFIFLTPITAIPVAATSRGIDIYLNGEMLNIPPSFGTPFYDKQGRLQIPMRYIIQSCGYEVVWSNPNRSVTIPTKSGDVVIIVDSNQLSTPKGKVTMDTSATVQDGRTYIPLRYALEALNFQVKWTAGSASDLVNITGQIGTASKRVPMTATEISDLASPATFFIEVSGDDNVPFASGSGFFIDPSGIGVTNFHVIQGATNAKITAVDGRTYTMSKVLYYNKDRDLVVFRATQSSKQTNTINVRYLNLAAPSSIRNGDVVYAIGSPLGLQNSITDGIVSNNNRILPGETFSFIQTSVPISHGNSGGPLINQYGEVVGINTASLTDGQNLNLAIPVKDLVSVNYKDSSKGMILSDICKLETFITPPLNLRVVGSNNDTAFIQWDAVKGAEYYHFYYQKAGDESYWYDGDNGPEAFPWCTGYTIDYYGLVPGTTYNVIVTSVKGGVESADSKVLTFTFKPNIGSAPTTPTTPTTPNNTLKYYPDAWWLVDFGATFGCTPSYHAATSEYIEYRYKYKEGIKLADYYNLMQSLGFVYNSDVTKSLEANFYKPLYFEHPKYGVSFVGDVDYNTGDFIIFTIPPN